MIRELAAPLLRLALLAILLAGRPVYAEEREALAKQAQNPISELITLPIEENFSFGDINFTPYISPLKSRGKYFWGVGPSLTVPSASDELLGTEKWSLGPSVIVLVEQGPWVTGFLVTNSWSIAGKSDRDEVNAMLVQPWLYYNTIRPHSALGYRPPAPEIIVPGKELPMNHGARIASRMVSMAGSPVVPGSSRDRAV
jgi:hypothetical protein